MKPDFITDDLINRFIDMALEEDIGAGDFSSLASISAKSVSKAQLLAKSNGVIAGVDLALKIFNKIDPTLEIEVLNPDGKTVAYGQIILFVSGKTQSILSAERLVLNCMQRMSGIATYTSNLVSLISCTKTKLLDTRKTTPGFRAFEKWAVHIGGGHNHRMGLYDMIMLKDNHIDFAGGISKAIEKTLRFLQDHSLDLKIEIETRTIAEVREVLAIGGVDYIMLDNMEVDTIKEAVSLIDNRFLTEASGGITQTNILQIAHAGVDFISVGALTHSYKSLDLSLKAVNA